MKFIELKTVQPYFDDVWNDKKPAECRLDDRNYEVGDILWLREYDPKKFDFNRYSGRSIICEVLSKIPKDTFAGLSPGYCLMGIKILSKREE
jgi:hypothetical protein